MAVYFLRQFQRIPLNLPPKIVARASYASSQDIIESDMAPQRGYSWVLG